MATDEKRDADSGDRIPNESGINPSPQTLVGATIEWTSCSGFARFIAAILLLSVVGLFVVAMWLPPSPAGLGTHQNLGRLLGGADWPPCTSVVMFGLPCPTCGMTTAFAYFVRGHWIASFHAQPAGFSLALGCALGAIFCAYVIVSGRQVRVRNRWFSAGRVAVLLIGVIVAGWAYKLIAMMTSGRL